MLKNSQPQCNWQAMALGRVHCAERGRAITVMLADQVVSVAGQAESVSYLQTDDKVICVTIEAQCYLLARLLDNHQSPAYHWQQTSDERILLQFGAATVCLRKAGQVIVANKKASFNLDEEGKLETYSQLFSVNSYRHVVIETATGNIYCRYPEVQG
jgi:hypothetical protein